MRPWRTSPPRSARCSTCCESAVLSPGRILTIPRRGAAHASLLPLSPGFRVLRNSLDRSAFWLRSLFQLHLLAEFVGTECRHGRGAATTLCAVSLGCHSRAKPRAVGSARRWRPAPNPTTRTRIFLPRSLTRALRRDLSRYREWCLMPLPIGRGRREAPGEGPTLWMPGDCFEHAPQAAAQLRILIRRAPSRGNSLRPPSIPAMQGSGAASGRHRRRR